VVRQTITTVAMVTSTPVTRVLTSPVKVRAFDNRGKRGRGVRQGGRAAHVGRLDLTWSDGVRT